MLVCPLCRLALGDAETTCPRDGGEGTKVELDWLPEELLARFEVTQPYGRGDSGDLYLATDRQSGRAGVLKCIRLPKAATPAERSRMKRELVKQGTLGNGFLAVPAATGEAGGRPWVFRERHEGVSLKARLAKGGALAVPEALTIAAQISAALDELHRSGLLHRDLKPGHVIVESQPSGHPKVSVIDAGVAAKLDTGRVFDVVGTPEYLSPEQAKGKLVSFRSDLYSLGCMLHEMLSGAPPFQGTTDELLDMHASKAAEPVEVDVPTGVAALLGQLLAKEPRERPFSAQQVRRALAPFLPEGAVPAISEAPRKRASVPAPPGGKKTRTSVPPPPKQKFKASVPPPPSKRPPPGASADSTQELSPVDLEQAEEIVAPKLAARKATLMGMPANSDAAAPSAEGTEELSPVDLEQAEEILAASAPVAQGLGSLAGETASAPASAPPASTDAAASAEESAPPWQQDEIRMTDPGNTAAPDLDDGGLDYDDLAETVMYDKDGKPEEAEQPQAASPQVSVAPVAAASPAPKKKSRPWGLIVLGLLVVGCFASTALGGGALYFLMPDAGDIGPVAFGDPRPVDPPPYVPPAPPIAAHPPAVPHVVAPPPVVEPVIGTDVSPTTEPVVEAAPEEPTTEPEPTEEPATPPVVAQAEPREPREPRPTTNEPREPRGRAGTGASSTSETPRETPTPTPPAASGPSRAEQFAAARTEALGHYRARRFPQAAQAYQRAIQANTRHAGSYAGLGACFLAMGQNANAIRAYQRAIQLSPRHAGFYAALGQAYQASGDAGRARQAWTRALALDPSNRQARSGLQRMGG